MAESPTTIDFKSLRDLCLQRTYKEKKKKAPVA